MSRPLILQQYYTRGRQGIFRANEGYDTVARTPGLDNAFIKKTLHPFCVYHAPRQLQERSETDLSQYPKALVCFRAESGELVLGQSAFVGADFTGQRNTFFSHNYVIPAAASENFVKEPARIFGVQSFQQEYDDTAGKELPALEDIPYTASKLQDKRKLLQELGIDERLFKQLLHAAMLSLSGKKKVFVSLPKDVAESSRQANLLLEIIYGCLPYEMRRHFGFLTYSNEPQSKKHIHLMVVEKGSIRLGNAHGDKDFMFDLANQRSLNAELTEGRHEYLDFVWEFLHDARILASFHAFCEEVLQGADRQTALQLATYYELCALYLIEQGRMSVYERNRPAIWQVLNRYLRQNGLVQKARLHELMDKLFQTEVKALAQQGWPEMEVVKAIIDAYAVARDEVMKVGTIQYLIDLLLKGKNAQKDGYVSEVFTCISGQRELFASLMRNVFASKPIVKPLFEDYLAERLKRVGDMTQMLKEIEFWAKNAPQAIRLASFVSTTIPKTLHLLAEEREKLDAVLQIHRFFATFAGSPSYAEELVDEVDKSLLKRIELSSLSKRDFDTVLSLLEEKPQTFFDGLDLEGRNKLDMMMNLASLEELTSIPRPEEFFRKWDARDIDHQQRLLQNMLDSLVGEESFSKVALVFYNAEGLERVGFRYGEMIAFVHQKGGDEALLSFLQWAMTQRMFFEGKQMEPPFRNALKLFFREDKGSRLRSKEWRKRWYAIRNADFRNMLDEVRSETTHPLVKFFRSKGTIVTGLILLVAAGAVSAYMLLQPDEPLPSTQPQPAEGDGQTASARPSQPIEVVPAYKLMLDPQIQPVVVVPVGSEGSLPVQTQEPVPQPITP